MPLARIISSSDAELSAFVAAFARANGVRAEIVSPGQVSILPADAELDMRKLDLDSALAQATDMIRHFHGEVLISPEQVRAEVEAERRLEESMRPQLEAELMPPQPEIERGNLIADSFRSLLGELRRLPGRPSSLEILPEVLATVATVRTSLVRMWNGIGGQALRIGSGLTSRVGAARARVAARREQFRIEHAGRKAKRESARAIAREAATQIKAEQEAVERAAAVRRQAEQEAALEAALRQYAELDTARREAAKRRETETEAARREAALRQPEPMVQEPSFSYYHLERAPEGAQPLASADPGEKAVFTGVAANVAGGPRRIRVAALAIKARNAATFVQESLKKAVGAARASFAALDGKLIHAGDAQPSARMVFALAAGLAFGVVSALILFTNEQEQRPSTVQNAPSHTADTPIEHASALAPVQPLATAPQAEEEEPEVVVRRAPRSGMSRPVPATQRAFSSPQQSREDDEVSVRYYRRAQPQNPRVKRIVVND